MSERQTIELKNGDWLRINQVPVDVTVEIVGDGAVRLTLRPVEPAFVKGKGPHGEAQSKMKGGMNNGTLLDLSGHAAEAEAREQSALVGRLDRSRGPAEVEKHRLENAGRKIRSQTRRPVGGRAL
jgi:hypothetical protein